MPAAVFRRASDLPQVIPVFPLDGALLLPTGELPLQIFEPRYLNMIDDVRAGDRMIGMVQTRSGGDRSRPNLAGVGCCGRITSFSETSDGRYLIGGDAERAREVADMAPPSAKDADLDSVRAALALADEAPEETGEFEQRLAKDDNDHEARFEIANALAARGAWDEAADHLLKIIERDRTWNDEAARKQLITIFEAAGAGSDVARTGRRRLSAILFS